MEPIGAMRSDYQAALICQTVVAASGNSKKSIPLSTFMPFLEQPEEDNSPEALSERIKAMLNSQFKEVKRA